MWQSRNERNYLKKRQTKEVSKKMTKNKIIKDKTKLNPLNKVYDMRLFQADSMKCVTFLDIFKKGRKKGDLLLTLKKIWASTRRFPGCMLDKDHHGNESDIDSEENNV